MHLIEEEFLLEGGKAGVSRKRPYLRGGGGRCHLFDDLCSILSLMVFWKSLPYSLLN